MHEGLRSPFCPKHLRKKGSIKMTLEWAYPESNEVRTTCKLCLNYCGMIVYKTKDGIKLRGNPSNPLSKGYLCPKGLAALDIGTNPDRILHPLRRVGARGSQRWERVSWEEAISGISSKLEHIIREYDAESVCVQSLPPKDYNIWQAFAIAIGTPNYFRHDHHICFTPQVVADTLTFGNVVTYLSLTSEDAVKTRAVVLWGVNMPETNPAKALVIEHARKAGAKLMVIDPRPIEVAKKADIWLRVRPGTDMALALGMMNVIIKENLYDKEFVEKWTYGFDKLARHVEKYPPAKVAEITWVDEVDINEAARIIATSKPAAIFTFIGLAMCGNSVNAIRSLGLLLGITGNVEVAGGNLIKSLPRTERFRFPEELLRKQMSADKFPLLSGPSSLSASFTSPNPADVVDAMITGKPYPIKALLTDANPVTALEDSKQVVEAFKKLELLVVLDLFMTPTGEFADYILPVTWFLESNGMTEYLPLNFIGARRRVFQPLGEAREEGEILLEILRSLGLINKLPVSTYQEYLNYRLKPLNLSFDEFAQAGYIVNPNIERKYEKGSLRADGKIGFNTPSGKIELYSTILEKYGYDPLPTYKEPVPSPYSTPDLFKDYPFIMVSGVRNLYFYHGLGLQIPRLRKHYPEPLVEISPLAAERLGLSEGDWVAIEVPGKSDKVRRKAHIVQGLHDNVVCPEGHWYLPEEQDQHKRLWGANINVLTSLQDDYDPIIGGSGCRCLLCRISRASPE